MSRPVEITCSDAAALLFPPCWFDAPSERTPPFFPAFCRVSMALQAALRSALPERLLSDVECFRDTRAVYPLLVYAASRPFPGQPRTDFTYDILNPALMRRFYFSVRQNLPGMLAEIYALLRRTGMDETARKYRPDHARDVIATVDRLKTCRRRLNGLLVAETWMMDDLVGFAGSQQLPERAKAKLDAAIAKQWLSRLRTLWAGEDFTNLGPELVAVVTGALRTPISARVPASPDGEALAPVQRPA